MQFLSTVRLTLPCLLATALPALGSSYKIIDFSFDVNGNALNHGDIIANGTDPLDTIFEIAPGVMVVLEVDNFRRDEAGDLGVIYNSEYDNGSGDRNGEDPDLESPFDGGNIENERLGNLLIIQENDTGDIGDNVEADDEGKRAAGTLDFYFDAPITELGFDLIDIENTEKGGGYFAVLFNGDNAVGQINFSALDSNTTGNPFYDNSIEFGNNTANRVAVQQISFWTQNASGGSVESVDRVRFQLGGSGALDNITFTATPSPTAAFAGLMGGFGLFLRRRRA